MVEEQDPQAKKTQSESAGCWKVLGLAVCASVLILIVLLTVAFTSLEDQIQALVAQNKTELSALQQRQDRPVLFGEPIDGEASKHYFECLKLTGVVTLKDSDPSPIQDFLKSEKISRSVVIARLKADCLPGPMPQKTSAEDQKNSAIARELFEKFGGPVVQSMRKGLRSSRCRWSGVYGTRQEAFHYALAMSFGLENGAVFLAYQAAQEPVDEGLITSLQILGYATELERNPMPSLPLEALSVRTLASQSYQHQLGRKPSEQALIKALTILTQLTPPDFKQTLDYSKIWTGRTLRDELNKLASGKKQETFDKHWLAPILGSRLVVALEWPTLIEFFRGYQIAYDQPWKNRLHIAKGLEKLSHKEVLKSLTALTYDVCEYLKNHTQALIDHHFMLFETATRIHYHRHGAWPKQAEDLKDLMKDIPKDPYSDSKQTYTFSVEGQKLLIKTGAPPDSSYPLRSLQQSPPK